jgi:putative PIN family toxin of toxin-antitoxin system
VALTAVFDTNILFSATAWRGSPFQCIERARVGDIQVVTCPELMVELAVKVEMKLGFSPEQAVETLADYLGFLRVVSIPKLLAAMPRDPADDMVLECAIEGKAQYIVTGDKDLLVLKTFRDIQIVSASDFLKVPTKGLG